MLNAGTTRPALAVRLRRARLASLAIVLFCLPLSAIEIAGDLYVDLDASDPSAGALEWVNAGDLDNFVSVGAPFAEVIDGADAVTFFLGDAYQSIDDAPDGLVGFDATRSIEVWAYNPEIAVEETLVAWSFRGGPDGTNMSFNYGTSPLFGAVGHWGAAGPDLGWGSVPRAAVWHHLAYTFDGETTRVYVDGVETNSELLGPGIINTHCCTKITLATQLADALGALAFGGTEGTLSLGRVRVHDGVLTSAQIAANFDEERGTYGIVDRAPEITGAPDSDEFTRNASSYSASFVVDGFPVPLVEVTSPVGATLAAGSNGSYTVTYPIPDPVPESFTVTVTATNSVDTAQTSWTVTAVDPPDVPFETAGELFVNLDASDASAGTASWANTGTLGDFLILGAPFADTVDGVPAVTFGAGDSYQCIDDAPPGVIGADPTRSIEVWAHNPEITTEETLIAWGHRGGPDGSNISFNYGNHGTWGAVGHWGAPDIAWNDAGGAPRANRWHHLVYTYDGTTTNVYADGELENTEFLGAGVINTHGGTKMTLATQIVDLAGTLDFGAREGLLSIARVRVHDDVLTPEQILANFELEREDFGIVDTAPQIVRAGLPLEGATFVRGAQSFSFNVSVEGFPDPLLEVSSTLPGAAIINGAEGSFSVQLPIPSPAPDSFDVTLVATNGAGRDEVGFTVTAEDPAGEIVTAGEVFVDVDAADEPGDTWLNRGTLSDLVLASGAPFVEIVSDAPAVVFNAGDTYQSQELAPDGLVGLDPTRSIEAWVHNPEITDEETIVSWGHRGGPDGSNLSFNYGTHGTWGAVGHWGPPDIGWDPAGGAPRANQWHHLVYTYDGATTRVYADGQEMNNEILGAGTINTHGGTPITVATQIVDAAGALDFGVREGVLSIGRMRIHDGVLSAGDVLNNYLAEKDDFPVPAEAPVFINFPLDGFIIAGEPYSAVVEVTGFPPPDFDVTPAGAEVTAIGGDSYRIDWEFPPDSSFEVVVTATNEAGNVGASWFVTVETLPPPGVIAEAGELFVDLDAADPTAGSKVWANDGTLGDFLQVGAPVAREVLGAPAVEFDGVNDAYQCVDFAPDGLTGIDPTRSIEVWAFNPVIANEETLLSWGQRGGPAGSNMSFNYGTSPDFGAVGHWGAPDIGWRPAGAGAPVAGAWHHLVYTYDGTTTRVYEDGVLANSEVLGAGVINTACCTQITLASQIEADGVTLTEGLRGSLALARVRVHDGVLSPAQVEHNYEAERERFESVSCPTTPFDPEFEDTSCDGLEVTGGPGVGTYTASATASDGTDDEIIYTFTAEDELGGIVTVGPQAESTADFELTAGSWTISVTVDDSPDCADDGAGATCSTNVVVEDRPPGVPYVRGDGNVDGSINLSDGIHILNVLFLGVGEFRCAVAADSNNDGSINLSDGVNIFNVLFLGVGAIPPPSACGEQNADPEDCAEFPPCN